VRAKSTINQQSGCLIAFGAVFALIGLPLLFVFAWVGVPFTAVGIGIICLGVAPYVRAMKVTPPEATLSSDLLRLGETFTFRFHQVFKGELTVDGGEVVWLMRESATYTRGTDTYTDTQEFVKRMVPIVGRTYRSGETLQIDETFAVPADAMHTFSAKNNKITWLVRVNIRIARWPDVKEEYPVVVMADRLPDERPAR